MSQNSNQNHDFNYFNILLMVGFFFVEDTKIGRFRFLVPNWLFLLQPDLMAF